MTQRLYNMYAKIVGLACKNVKQFIKRAETLASNEDKDKVDVTVYRMDDVVGIVENIMRDPSQADVLYSQRIASELSITAPFEFAQKSILSKVFIDSLVRSRNARFCQKQLIDAMLIEMYMNEAWKFDEAHKGRTYFESAVLVAKDVVTKLFSLSSFTNFVFDDGAPHLDPNIKANLEQQAFDPRYSLTNKAKNEAFVRRKYAVDFAGRDEFFMTGIDKTLFEMEKENAELRRRAVASLEPKKSSVDIIMMTELYKGAFANLPMQNRRRKFVNLKARNRDIQTAPAKFLEEKRRYASLEAMTKYWYIMNYYKRNEPKPTRSERDTDIYYFNREAEMYRYIWNNNASVKYKNGALVFDNGVRIKILPGDKPFETLHKVNAMYASLFGFTPDDMKGGDNWLYDSVRRAYTDEGIASYRLAFIDAKAKGKV